MSAHLRLIMNNLPNMKVIGVVMSVFCMMMLTWNPESSTPNSRMSYANTRLKRTLRQCLEYPIELEGTMALDLENTPDLDLLANHEFTDVKPGGRWQSYKCIDPLTVLVIIPFRDVNGDRTRNLKYLIMQLHYIMQRHMLKYVIVVSQQNGTEGFTNKGLLMNLAYRHISMDQMDEEYGCVVFNDVDLIPVTDQNFYGCDPDNPKHMSAYVNDKIVTYNRATGGVLSMPTRVFRAINGFSNKFWGWGNEDDDMYGRIISEKFTLQRSEPDLGQYLHMPHKRSYNSTGYKPPSGSSYKSDGLNSLQEVRVKLLETSLLPLYTLLNFAVEQPDSKLKQ